MQMTKIDENIQTAQNMLSGIVERCYELEEENKKLKEDVKDLVERNIELDKKYTLVLTENEKLREELSAYDREFRDEDNKAKNIYKSQKENILMGKN